MHQPTRSLRPVRILRMLRQGGCFSLAELAKSFSVCERTVQRDLLLLKKAGIGIQFDADRKTYCVVNPADNPPPQPVRSEHIRLLATAARSSSLYAAADRRLAIESAIAALSNGGATPVDGEMTSGPSDRTEVALVSAPRAVLTELGRPLAQRRAVRTRIEHPATGWEWRLTLVPLQLLVADEKPALLAKSPLSTTLFLIDLETICTASLTEELYDVEAPTEAEIVQAQRLF